MKTKSALLEGNDSNQHRSVPAQLPISVVVLFVETTHKGYGLHPLAQAVFRSRFQAPKPRIAGGEWWGTMPYETLEQCFHGPFLAKDKVGLRPGF